MFHNEGGTALCPYDISLNTVENNIKTAKFEEIQKCMKIFLVILH